MILIINNVKKKNKNYSLEKFNIEYIFNKNIFLNFFLEIKRIIKFNWKIEEIFMFFIEFNFLILFKSF